MLSCTLGHLLGCQAFFTLPNSLEIRFGGRLSGLFPFIAESCSWLWVSPCDFSHVPREGHLGSFQFASVTNKAAVKVDGQLAG